MSNFPTNLDDDVTLPRVDNNITEIGDAAVNALRDAMFNTQANIGIGAQGTQPSIAERFALIFDSGDNIQLSFLAQLPQYANIVNSQISPTAGIKESKLDLDHGTAYLYNLISNFNTNLNTALNFIINTGSKFEPHLQGITYRHVLSHIDVFGSNAGYLKNKLGLFRDNTNAYTVLSDINSDYVAHQKANGTTTGEVPPTNYAHVASGIKLKSENFASIPQVTTDVQKLADYLDGAGILTIGTRIQTLFQNGIPRASRSNTLVPTTVTSDALSQVQQGKPIVPITTVTTYLSNTGNSTVDDINTGDDIVQFTPSAGQLTNNAFDAQFSTVSAGDVVSVNYGSVIVPFIVKEAKYVADGSDRTFIVRIHGKNLSAGTTNTARIDKSLFNTNKFGELALSAAPAPTNTVYPSLIVSSPRGAQVLGIGFNPNLLDQNHYNLYLALYPTGNPSGGVVTMAAIDVTGNAGTTPGKYTLGSIVESMNQTFRKPGFNYRFVAFSYQGNFGIMLADSINGASFSIIDGVLGASGTYDQSLSNTTYALNVIDRFNNIDPLGLGPNGANVSSPPYSVIFNPVLKAQNPMKMHVPLGKNTYYVNGAEKEKLNTEPAQVLDQNKDGYWPAKITNKLIIAGTRVQVTYTVTGSDLSSSSLKAGKTIVVQTESGGTVVDFGRFTIESVQFKTCDGYIPATEITVYDAVHSIGSSPYVSSGVGTSVRLYFSSDSVSFNNENATDTAVVTNYKRHFETYIDVNALTFTHERARMLLGGTNGSIGTDSFPLYASAELSNWNIYSVSPKLRGYALSQSFKRINLQISHYDALTGTYDGYLCNYNGTTAVARGPVVSGKRGEIARFRDETNVDWIDLVLDIDNTLSTFSTPKNIDIQLFPSLALDEDVMPLGTCQVNDSTKELFYVRDGRQFGNVSEKQLSTSAINFINAGDRILHQNGTIGGFDITGTASNAISITGGIGLVDGQLINMNGTTLKVPLIQEVQSATTYSKINWALCLSVKGEFEFVALTDYDATSPATPNVAGRIVTVKNPISSLVYAVDSRSFTEIVELRKDLTVLYKVTSVVDNTGALTSLSYHDARKYSVQTDSIINPVLTTDRAQGNFYTFDSLATWIQYNARHHNVVGIKSDITVTSAYTLAPSYTVNLNGNGVSTLTFASGSVVNFTNFNFNQLPIVITTGATVSFTNCTFDNVTMTIAAGSNVTFFNSSVKNSNWTLNKSLTFSSPISFFKTAFTINSSNGFVVNTDDFTFNKCQVTHTYDASVDGYYVTGSTVNLGAGIFTVANSVSFQRKNLSVTNNTFINTTADYYAAICLEFNHADAQYQDLLIKGNKFYNTIVTDSTRALIVLANNYTLTSVEGPRLVHAEIQDNVCDKNQAIAIYTKADGSSNINNALSAVSCLVSGNVCGSILYTTRYETKRGYANTSNQVKDKESGLIISDNNCKVIGAGYSSGNLIVEGGKVSLERNAISSIHTSLIQGATTTERRASVTIRGNTFSALPTGSFGVSAYALQIDGYNVSGNPKSIIIDENIFDFGTTVAIDGVTKTVGYYTGGNIVCNAPCQITNNILKGIGNVAGSPLNNSIIYVDGDAKITGNSIYRGTFSLGSGGNYIYLASGNSIVTDNFFDSPTVDGTSDVLVDMASGVKAVYERNKNQTGYKAISFAAADSTHSDGVQVVNDNSAAFLAYLDGNDTSVNPVYWDLFAGQTGQLAYRKIVDVAGALPNAVQIIEAKIGISTDSGESGVPNGNATVNLLTAYMTSSSISKANFATATSSILNPNFGLTAGFTTSNFSTVTFETLAKVNALSSVPQYLDLVAPSTSDFNTGTDNTITVKLKWLCNLTTLNDGRTFFISPLVIKYRW